MAPLFLQQHLLTSCRDSSQWSTTSLDLRSFLSSTIMATSSPAPGSPLQNQAQLTDLISHSPHLFFIFSPVPSPILSPQVWHWTLLSLSSDFEISRTNLRGRRGKRGMMGEAFWLHSLLPQVGDSEGGCRGRNWNTRKWLCSSQGLVGCRTWRGQRQEGTCERWNAIMDSVGWRLSGVGLLSGVGSSSRDI